MTPREAELEALYPTGYGTPEQIAAWCVADGAPIDIYTHPWRTFEGAKVIFERLNAIYPRHAITLRSVASGLVCGFVPDGRIG